MNVLNLVRETIRDIEEGQIRTSLIIQKCLRIAGYIRDSHHLALFRLIMRDNHNKLETTKIRESYRTNLLKEGITEIEIRNGYNKIIDEYIQLKTINAAVSKDIDGKTLSFALSEIETRLDGFQTSLERNTIPEGLHSLDLYYENKSKRAVDSLLIDGINSYRSILEKIRTKASTFLVDIEIELLDDNGIVEKEPTMNKNVFIIHGHNEAKWRELEKMLKTDFEVNPIILSEQPDKGITTLIDKFEFYANQCSYAFALFTPDDIVENQGNKYFQARPNVIFELGWFVARLGRRNVCLILQDNQETIQMFSDFQGVIQKRFRQDVKELYRDIMLELKDVGVIQ